MYLTMQGKLFEYLKTVARRYSLKKPLSNTYTGTLFKKLQAEVKSLKLKKDYDAEHSLYISQIFDAIILLNNCGQPILNTVNVV